MSGHCWEHPSSARGVLLWALLGGVVLSMVVVELMMQAEMWRIQERVGKIEGEMMRMRDLMYKVI